MSSLVDLKLKKKSVDTAKRTIKTNLVDSTYFNLTTSSDIIDIYKAFDMFINEFNNCIDWKSITECRDYNSKVYGCIKLYFNLGELCIKNYQDIYNAFIIDEANLNCNFLYTKYINDNYNDSSQTNFIHSDFYINISDAKNLYGTEYYIFGDCHGDFFPLLFGLLNEDSLDPKDHKIKDGATVILLGDVFDPFNNGDVPDLNQDFESTLDRKNKINIINKKNFMLYNTVIFFYFLMYLMNKKNINIIWILGNHDISHSFSYFYFFYLFYYALFKATKIKFYLQYIINISNSATTPICYSLSHNKRNLDNLKMLPSIKNLIDSKSNMYDKVNVELFRKILISSGSGKLDDKKLDSKINFGVSLGTTNSKGNIGIEIDSTNPNLNTIRGYTKIYGHQNSSDENDIGRSTTHVKDVTNFFNLTKDITEIPKIQFSLDCTSSFYKDSGCKPLTTCKDTAQYCKKCQIIHGIKNFHKFEMNYNYNVGYLLYCHNNMFYNINISYVYRIHRAIMYESFQILNQKIFNNMYDTKMSGGNSEKRQREEFKENKKKMKLKQESQNQESQNMEVEETFEIINTYNSIVDKLIIEYDIDDGKNIYTELSYVYDDIQTIYLLIFKEIFIAEKYQKKIYPFHIEPLETFNICYPLGYFFSSSLHDQINILNNFKYLNNFENYKKQILYISLCINELDETNIINRIKRIESKDEKKILETIFIYFETLNFIYRKKENYNLLLFLIEITKIFIKYIIYILTLTDDDIQELQELNEKELFDNHIFTILIIFVYLKRYKSEFKFFNVDTIINEFCNEKIKLFYNSLFLHKFIS